MIDSFGTDRIGSQGRGPRSGFQGPLERRPEVHLEVLSRIERVVWVPARPSEMARGCGLGGGPFPFESVQSWYQNNRRFGKCHEGSAWSFEGLAGAESPDRSRTRAVRIVREVLSQRLCFQDTASASGQTLLCKRFQVSDPPEGFPNLFARQKK